MPPATSRTNPYTFVVIVPPRAGAFYPHGAPRRLTSRGMNDAVIRASDPPRLAPRSLAGPEFFGRLQRAGLSFVTAYGDFTEGVLEGLKDSLVGTWQLVAHDLWHARTYTELGTTLLALNLLDPFHLADSLAAGRAFDARWGTHVAQRQVEILAAINKLVRDVPNWTPRQWGRAVGRLVGDILLAKGAGAAVKVGLRVAVSESVQLSTISSQLQSLGRVSAGTSKLARARAILPVYARFTMVRTVIPLLDVRTGANQASFWSGLEELAAGTSPAEHAQALARASGRSTLEMTKGGAWLDRQTALFDQRLNWVQQLRPQWGRLSSRFAARAQGTVDMYKGPRYAGPQSVWEQYERAPLEMSRQTGRVRDIRIIEVPKR